jgi:hypothetical protein
MRKHAESRKNLAPSTHISDISLSLWIDLNFAVCYDQPQLASLVVLFWDFASQRLAAPPCLDSSRLHFASNLALAKSSKG